MIRKLVKTLLAITIFLVVVLSIFTASINRQVDYKGQHPATKGETLTIFLVDGLSKSIFDTLLSHGQLPHLQQLISTGTYVEHGIGSFPSMTGYAFFPFITGVDAAQSGIYGLRWLDRSRDEGNLRNYVGRTNIHMNEDVNPEIVNLFELSEDQYTASINSYMNRGAQDAVITGWKHTTSKYYHSSLFQWMHRIPFFGERLVFDYLQHESYAMQLAMQQLERNPKVQWVTLASLDAMNHIHGTTGDYSQLLIHIDSLIGQFVQRVEDLGQSDMRAIAIVSDHGVSDVLHNIDLREAFYSKLQLELERGTSAHIATDKLNTPLSSLSDKDGYLVINGNLSNYLYFTNPNESVFPQQWRDKLYYHQLSTYPTVHGRTDLLEFLSKEEGVGIIACQLSDTSVWIQYKDHKATITKREEKYKYSPIVGDPLGYGKDSTSSLLTSEGYMSADQCIAYSLETEYPGALYRLYELMIQEGVGDIVISSEDGYDLAKEYEMFVSNFKGGHGGLKRELIDVPYIVYFPDRAPRYIEYATSETLGRWIKEYIVGASPTL